MTRMIVGAMMAGALLVADARPATAQDVHISLSWGSFRTPSGLRVVGHYRHDERARRAPYRVERRHHLECVREGAYLYCWDDPRAFRGRPLVHVYVTERDVARRYDRGRRGWDRNWMRQRERAAARAWRRWADAHRHRYDRDRLLVDVEFGW